MNTAANKASAMSEMTVGELQAVPPGEYVVDTEGYGWERNEDGTWVNLYGETVDTDQLRVRAVR